MSNPTKFHGYRSGDGPAIHIGNLPGRKKPCLYIAVSNEFMATVEVLATFRSEASARAAQTMLDLFILKTKDK